MDKVLKLIWISRPISWPNTSFPFGATYLVTGGTLDYMFWIGTLFFLFPYNLLMYGVNDVFDYESDIKNPRKGGVEGMKEQKAFHPTILYASAIICIPFVMWLLLQGTTNSKLVLAGLIFFVIAYSAPKLRFKEKPVLDSITSSLHFVGPMIYALSITNFHAEAWSYVAAFFFWGMASHAFGAVQDILPDRQGGISSIATISGAKATVSLSLVLYSAAVLILLLQGMPSILIGITGIAYVLNIWQFNSITDIQSAKTNVAWRRFIWLNFLTGFVITMILISKYLLN